MSSGPDGAPRPCLTALVPACSAGLWPGVGRSLAGVDGTGEPLFCDSGDESSFLVLGELVATPHGAYSPAAEGGEAWPGFLPRLRHQVLGPFWPLSLGWDAMGRVQ